MKKYIPLFVFCFLIPLLLLSQEIKYFDYSAYVDPFSGTKNMGHTYPGATVPFGMVQLSPETDTVHFDLNGKYNEDVYRYCSGYQYEDNTIVGFTHTHFSGTGHSDLGDFLIMPTTGEIKLNPGNKFTPHSGYRSVFSHANESASPGYYSVLLDDYDIKAELTATERTGFHKYTFPESEASHIILDLCYGIYNYDGKNVWTFVRVENDTLITGFKMTSGWARTRFIYFAMVLSKPIKDYGFKREDGSVYRGFWRRFNQEKNFPEAAGREIKMFINYSTKQNEEIKIKFGISGVSSENALMNLREEIPGWDFDTVKDIAREKWNKELSKVEAELPGEKMKMFYTSLYHSYLSPTIYNDVNGDYRGLDMNIHHSKDFTNYSTFSLWDTYRALHPLFTVIQQKRVSDMVNSMLVHYEQSVHKMLPVWSHQANENWCMIGYHAVSVIADAINKKLTGFDYNKAFDAAIKTSNADFYDGIGLYKKYGYVPEDLNSNSASKTLEYSYDDWAIYSAAKTLGMKNEENDYYKRSLSYKNIFDASTGFIRAKDSKGEWKSPFAPLSTLNQGYIEGNAWNYSFYVPHDAGGYIKLLGGENAMISKLDSLFTMYVDDKYFKESEDVTRDGVIGNYVHGNEPSHHIAYLYAYAGAPWKTQERINLIMNTMYKNGPDGLCGNDDCGQMSAWYIFSALGFYPVCPGTNEYVIGAPQVKKAVIYLENGKKFNVVTDNYSENNIYIKEVSLNGIKLERLFITHEEIMQGGELRFVMSSVPDKERGKNKEYRPYSMSGY
ncbi:MAG: GH92 family glycosyl hydrolase [Ignavibacteria bacterium]|nr:GH92 family glycosyl hydrolase [Ignavibacteria bacterium]